MSETIDYDWRHGWVPLTMRAALQKAKGDREAAARLLGEARADRRSRRREFVTPHPRHRAEHAERKRWARYTDDDLAAELAAADDDASLTRIVAELDRRDRAEAKAERRRQQHAARRSAAEAARDREFDAATDAGEDPETAYSRIYGVSEERQRREAAAESLRGAGYFGKTFREQVAAAHAGHVNEMFQEAEEACRGHVLNAAGKRAGIDPESLFSGPAARAKKYASPELMDWFRDNGRLTVEDFTAVVLGGHMKQRTAGDSW